MTTLDISKTRYYKCEHCVVTLWWKVSQIVRLTAEKALALTLAVAIGLSPFCARAYDWIYPGSGGFLFTGGGSSFATTNFALSVNPAWANCRLQLGFGFATDETNAISSFQDSFSITLQTQDYLSTLLLQTADVNGVTWAPENPGGLEVSPDLVLREALQPTDAVAGYDMAFSFAVSLVLPSAFVGTTSMLYLDLFDNGNALNSVGWLSYARLVPGLMTNTAPLLLVHDWTVDEQVPFAITLNALDTDVPTNRIAFELISGPSGLTVDRNSGDLKWTPGEAQGPYTHTVTVRVTDDGVPALSTTQSFQIVVREVNVAPVVEPLANCRIQDGREFAFAALATDTDLPAQTLIFSLGAGAPAGAAITSGGQFRWVPDVGQTGEFDIAVNVVDTGSPARSASTSFHVTVVGVGNLSVQGAGKNFQFSNVTDADIDVIAQKVRIPVTSGFKLFRLVDDRPTRITGIRIVGGMVVLSYVVEARDVRLQFALSPEAPFASIAEAAVDETAQTIRANLSPGTRFFKVTADVLTRIVSIRIEGGQVVIRYVQTGESVP